jgi:hypothetical protein
VTEAALTREWRTCDRARIARDRRFDGWFVTFFATAAAGQRGGTVERPRKERRRA